MEGKSPWLVHSLVHYVFIGFSRLFLDISLHTCVNSMKRCLLRDDLLHSNWSVLDPCSRRGRGLCMLVLEQRSCLLKRGLLLLQ